MQCNRYTASGICCLVVVIAVIFLAVVLRGMTGDTNTNDNDVTGNKNTIKTDNSKEVSLLHIEGLKSGQNLTNGMVILGFTIILSLFGYTVYHQRSRKRARRIIKEYEREELMNKISDMESELVTRGFLPKPKSKKKKPVKNINKSKRSVKALKKKKKAQDIEAKDDSSESE